MSKFENHFVVANLALAFKDEEFTELLRGDPDFARFVVESGPSVGRMLVEAYRLSVGPSGARPSAPRTKPTAAVPVPVAVVVTETENLPVPSYAREEIVERVLVVMEECTGYPRDMLELHADFEADLGVDSIKQMEVLAALGQAFRLKFDPTIRLPKQKTIATISDFLVERIADGASSANA